MSAATAAGPGHALLADVVLAVLVGGQYWLRSAWIRWALLRARGCANPLHRAEATSRAAVAQTALVLQVVVLGVGGLPLPWVVPAWLLHDWPGVLVCVAVALAAVLIPGRWRSRRRRELGFTEQGCEQRCWL